MQKCSYYMSCVRVTADTPAPCWVHEENPARHSDSGLTAGSILSEFVHHQSLQWTAANANGIIRPSDEHMVIIRTFRERMLSEWFKRCRRWENILRYGEHKPKVNLGHLIKSPVITQATPLGCITSKGQEINVNFPVIPVIARHRSPTQTFTRLQN